MGNEGVTCQTCGAMFPTRQELDRHSRQAHAEANNTRWTSAPTQHQAVGGMSCPDCGAQFSSIGQVERHRRRDHQSY